MEKVNDVVLQAVDYGHFILALDAARADSDKVAEATSPSYELEHNERAQYTLTADGLSGFIVMPNGELTSVFSLVKGRGSYLITWAILMGATRLDCFDGYLTGFYRRFGFSSYMIVPNWTPGGPAVHFMKLPAA